MAVPVEVALEDPVAIIVEPVADLGRARANVGVGVIAIEAVLGVVVRIPARMVDRHGRVAEAVPVAVSIEGDDDAFVRRVVTIVVDPIAELGRRGIHARGGIVTIAPAIHRIAIGVAASRVRAPVSIRVAHAEGAGVAILVAIGRVADLGVARVAKWIGVVAIVASTRAGEVSVPVRVSRLVTLGQARGLRLDAHLPL